MCLKIALASNFHFSEYHGGNEVYTHELAQSLSKHNCQVTYFSSSKVGNIYNYTTQQFSTLKYHNRPIYSNSLVNQIKKNKPDIFHFTGSGLPLVFAALQLNKLNKIPIIHTYQGPLNPNSIINKIGARLEQKLIKSSSSGLITTTPTISEYVNEYFPNINSQFIPMSLKPAFLSTVHNQQTSQRNLNLKSNKKYILFVGKLDSNHYYKGLQVLLSAVSLLSSDYQLIVVGDGQLKTFYQHQSQKLKINHRTVFAGFVQEALLPEYYSASDVFVLPSTSNSEGFGLVLIEAMAMNKPVISTKAIGSYSWFKQQQVANFVNPNDPVELANSIKYVIENPNIKLITKAKKFAHSFSPDQMATQTIEFYKSLLRI